MIQIQIHAFDQSYRMTHTDPDCSQLGYRKFIQLVFFQSPYFFRIQISIVSKESYTTLIDNILLLNKLDLNINSIRLKQHTILYIKYTQMKKWHSEGYLLSGSLSGKSSLALVFSDFFGFLSSSRSPYNSKFAPLYQTKKSKTAPKNIKIAELVCK